MPSKQLSLTAEVIDKLLKLADIENNQSTTYFKDSAATSPIKGDCRIRTTPTYRAFEKHDGTNWIAVYQFGSVVTDQVIVKKIGTEQYIRIGAERTDGTVANIWQNAATPGGVRYGDILNTMFLNTDKTVKIAFPVSATLTSSVVGSTSVAGGTVADTVYSIDYTPSQNMAVVELRHTGITSCKARFTVIDKALNTVVYQSLNDSDFSDNGGVQLKNKGDNAVTGVMNVVLRAPINLVGSRVYTFKFESSEGSLSLAGAFPLTTLNWVTPSIEDVMTRQYFKQSIGPWVYAATYKAGDIVTRNNMFFEANSDIGSSTSWAMGTVANTWKPLLRVGTYFSYKGAYSSSTVYSIDDVVQIGHNVTDLFVAVSAIPADNNYHPTTGIYRNSWVRMANTGATIFTPSSTTLPGQLGLVPAPIINQTHFLKADGKWVSPHDIIAHSTTLAYGKGDAAIKYGIMVVANDTIPAGTAFTWGTAGATWRPQPLGMVGTAAWKGVFTNGVTYVVGDIVCLTNTSTELYIAIASATAGATTHPVTGSLRYVWGNYKTENIPYYSGASSSVSGQTGLVPPALVADKDKFLKGDATWFDIASYFIPVGTIIDWYGGVHSLPTPTGYWQCDGSTINSPGSPLHNKLAPDLRDRVIAGSGGIGSSGATVGADSYTFARNNLPNINLSGSTSYTPTGGITVNTGGTHSHSFTIDQGWNGLNNVGASDRSGSSWTRYTSDAGSHSHTGSFTGEAATISISNIQLNGNATQAALDMRQKTMYVTKLIKI